MCVLLSFLYVCGRGGSRSSAAHPSTLQWYWGLCAPVIRRAMSAIVFTTSRANSSQIGQRIRARLREVLVLIPSLSLSWSFRLVVMRKVDTLTMQKKKKITTRKLQKKNQPEDKSGKNGIGQKTRNCGYFENCYLKSSKT